jgi:hypothetical protein
MPLPEAVHHDTAGERVIGARQPLREFQAAAAVGRDR